MTLDTWHVTPDTWHVTHDMWNMVGVENSLKISARQLLRLGMDTVHRTVSWRFWTKGWHKSWPTESVNDEGVYRKAPATPGLLISVIGGHYASKLEVIFIKQAIRQSCCFIPIKKTCHLWFWKMLQSWKYDLISSMGIEILNICIVFFCPCA